MKKILIVALSSLFIASTAFAEAPTNKAIGYDGDLDGLSLRLITASGIGVQGIVGLNIESPKASGAGSGMDLNIGANVFKSLWSADKVNLNGFVGIEFMSSKPPIKDADSETDFAIMVGGEPEIFLLSNLSVSTKFGFRVLINGDHVSSSTGKKVTDSGSTVFGTFGNRVSIVDGFSFNWYF